MAMKKMNVRAVPQLTAEELNFAIANADFAYSGKMITKPIEEIFRPLTIGGKTIVPTDIPMNRAAGALLESMKHDPEKARAALHRTMMIAFDAFNDPRCEQWLKKDGEQQLVHGALLEAIATIPTSWGKPVSMDRVYKLAEKIAARDELEPE
jgi:hypothetical protein